MKPLSNTMPYFPLQYCSFTQALHCLPIIWAVQQSIMGESDAEMEGWERLTAWQCRSVLAFRSASM